MQWEGRLSMQEQPLAIEQQVAKQQLATLVTKHQMAKQIEQAASLTWRRRSSGQSQDCLDDRRGMGWGGGIGYDGSYMMGC